MKDIMDIGPGYNTELAMRGEVVFDLSRAVGYEDEIDLFYIGCSRGLLIRQLLGHSVKVYIEEQTLAELRNPIRRNEKYGHG